MERKKSEQQIQGTTNMRRPILNPTIQLADVNLYTKYEIYAWRERKVNNKYREQQIREGPFSILQYNLLISTCIPNMKFLSKMVVFR